MKNILMPLFQDWKVVSEHLVTESNLLLTAVEIVLAMMVDDG
jgi:hypothetical protein